MILCGATATAGRAFARDVERQERAVEARLAEARAQIAYCEEQSAADARLHLRLRMPPPERLSTEAPEVER